MRESYRGRRFVVSLAVAMMMASPGSSPTLGASPSVAPPGIPSCPRLPAVPPDPRAIGRPVAGPLSQRTPAFAWGTAQDATGVISGHSLRLGARVRWQAGPRAFVDGPFGQTLVAGERSRTGTRLRLIDLSRGCATRVVDIGALVYGSVVDTDGRLAVSLVDPDTRAELGVWRVDSGPSSRLRRIIAPPAGKEATATPRELSLGSSPMGITARWCAGGSCVSRGSDGLGNGLAALVDLDPDAETDATASLPLRSPRPVPVYDRWFPWTVLSFRFHSTDTSPSWMRAAVLDAADDATDTSKSLSPIFTPVDSGAQGVIRYTASFPSSCLNAIACASHDVDQWTLRMRPQGYDFRWGELHWCQKTLSDGCFDAERVALHEFGHIVGLDHPEAAGFQLAPSVTVMHQVTASRPHASWDRHSFAPCDVASLQEQFGTPTTSTLISTCNDVDTRLTLSGSASTIAASGKLVLTATLRVRSDGSYGQVSGTRLNGRSVQLRRRVAGSGGSWTTSWMKATDTSGVYTLTLYPRTTYEYQAAFSAPDNEGLNSDTSDLLTVRVTSIGGCTGSCPNEEDPS